MIFFLIGNAKNKFSTLCWCVSKSVSSSQIDYKPAAQTSNLMNIISFELVQVQMENPKDDEKYREN